MESAELEVKINAFMDELTQLDFGNLDAFEKLLISEFMDAEEPADSSIWTDCFRDHLEYIESNLIGFAQFRKFLIRIGIIDTHIVCGAFYLDDIENVFTAEELEKISDLPLCEEDDGRSDSCFGVHFFLTLQPNILETTLVKLLNMEHYDSGFFPWLIARSKVASPELLASIAKDFTHTTSWRHIGEYKTGFALNISDSISETFVLWNIANNPNTPKDTFSIFENEIRNLRDSSSNELSIQIRDKNLEGIGSSWPKEYTPKFTGNTSDLKYEFLEWLEKLYSTADIFDDELEYEIEVSEVSQNLESLKSRWVARLEQLSYITGQNRFIWQLVGIREPIENQKIPLAPECIVDMVYQEMQFIPIDKNGLQREEQTEPTGRWKLCLIQTGTKEEYSESQINKLLAWQMTTVATHLEIELSSGIGEIDWVRIGEFEYPLSSHSPEEISTLADQYLEEHFN